MPMDQMIEFYKSLIQIAVALVAVSITAYSIALSIMGPAWSRLKTETDARKKALDRKLASGAFKDTALAKKEIDANDAEIKRVDQVVSDLSLKSVVILPSFFLGVSIGISLLAIYSFPRTDVPTINSGRFEFLSMSVFCLGCGVVLLFRALSGIQKTAGQPRPTETLAEPPSLTTLGDQISESVSEKGAVAYYFPDYGQKTIVDWNRKIAYWFDYRIDSAARQGKIRVVAILGKNQVDFIKEKGLTEIIRAPTEKELPL